MLVSLRNLFLIVQVERVEPIRASNGLTLIPKLVLSDAVAFPHRYLIHQAGNFLLRVLYLLESHVKYVSHLRNLEPLLAYFVELIRIVKLLGGEEGLKDD